MAHHRHLSLTTLVFACLIASPTYAAKSEIHLQQERALVTSNMFKALCFTTLADPEKIQNIAKKPFIEFEEGKQKQSFLSILNAPKGKVWGANFPQGNFVLISEPDNKCHIVVQKADEELLHKEIKNLSEEASKNLPHSKIEYRYETTGNNTSIIEVKSDPDDFILMRAIVTTMPDPPENKPAALMTVIAK